MKRLILLLLIQCLVREVELEVVPELSLEPIALCEEREVFEVD